MTLKCTKLNFSAQDVFVGLDISLKSWKVCIYVGQCYHRTFSQPPKPEPLVRYLHQNFPGGRFHCVYEAGYFGFWIHDALQEEGIECMVVNPADVPTAHWEKTRKTDRVDANKLARSLAIGPEGHLRPIFIPSRQSQEDRTLVRMRERCVQHQTRIKNRIKAMAQYYGFSTPDDIADQHWSRRYLHWLEQIQWQHASGDYAFRLLLNELLAIRQSIADLTRQIRAMSNEDRYRTKVEHLCTVPGVSVLTAMILLTEFCRIDRFRSSDHLASYVGLVPGEYSSGERQIITGLTYRRNTSLRRILIESAWIAVRKDPVLLLCFSQWAARMPKSKAIVKIARKLLNRIRFVLTHETPYQLRYGL
jgi:transposase